MRLGNGITVRAYSFTHRKIDTILLNSKDGSHNDDDGIFVKFLIEWLSNYQVCILNKKIMLLS